MVWVVFEKLDDVIVFSVRKRFNLPGNRVFCVRSVYDLGDVLIVDATGAQVLSAFR